jgi:hypothetical protein
VSGAFVDGLEEIGIIALVLVRTAGPAVCRVNLEWSPVGGRMTARHGLPLATKAAGAVTPAPPSARTWPGRPGRVARQAHPGRGPEPARAAYLQLGLGPHSAGPSAKTLFRVWAMKGPRLGQRGRPWAQSAAVSGTARAQAPAQGGAWPTTRPSRMVSPAGQSARARDSEQALPSLAGNNGIGRLGWRAASHRPESSGDSCRECGHFDPPRHPGEPPCGWRMCARPPAPWPEETH